MPTISNLPTLTTATGTVIVPVVENGTAKKASLAQLGSYFGSGPGGGSLTVGLYDETNTLNSQVNGVTTIGFDSVTGFQLDQMSPNTVKISLGSTFKTWKVTGQQDLVAVGEDTVEFVAGNNITLTTNPNTNPKRLTISASGSANSISNGSYTLGINSAGAITNPDNSVQYFQNGTVCEVNTSTIIYTTTAESRRAIRLFVVAEGPEDTGGPASEVQACDITVVKSFNTTTVSLSAFGLTYSGQAPLAYFDAQLNQLSNTIEITCQPTNTDTGVTVNVQALEM